MLPVGEDGSIIEELVQKLERYAFDINATHVTYKANCISEVLKRLCEEGSQEEEN